MHSAGVVWPASRIDLGDASIFDAELLAEEFDSLLEAVDVGPQADSGVDAVGGPAASGYDRVVGQRDDV